MASSNEVYVSFGGNTSGLEAAVATARATVNKFQRDLANLSREFVATGASVESELGQKLLAAAGKVDIAKHSFADLKSQMQSLSSGAGLGLEESIKNVGEAASHAHTGLGFYVREVHALFDELGSGRDRQALGTLSNVIGTTLQSNLAMIPYAAAIGAVAAAFGYLGYQAYTANAAIKGIQLDAAVAGFQLADAQAKALYQSIERLADVGNSTAQDIAKPFLALGPVGATVAQLAAVHLPALAEQMGKKLPEAAEEIAKRFSDLDGAGRKFVTSAGAATEAQRQQYAAFVSAGQAPKAYGIIIDVMAGQLSTYESKSKLALAATIDAAAALGDASLAGGDMAAAQAHLGEATAAATAQIDQEKGALAGLRAELDGVSNAAAAFREGMAAALKGSVAGEIAATTGEIKKLEAGIEAAGDKSSPSIDIMGAKLDQLRDKLKKLNQEQAAGPGGGDAVSNMKQKFEVDDSSFKGSDADRLREHQAAMQALLATDKLTAEQRKALEADVAKNARAIQDAENESFLRQGEAKVSGAGKNSVQIIALRQAEVQHEIALYGEGSKQAEAAEDRLARAKEQAATRGAASAKAAAKDELGATEEGIKGQIAAIERHTAAMIMHLQTELKLRRITSQAETAAVVDALTQEKAKVDALYAQLDALGGLSLTKKKEFADAELAFNDKNANQMYEAQAKAAEKTEQAWDKAMSSINGAFDSQISGLLKGTETVRAAFKNIAADLAEQGIKSGVNAILTGGENVVKGALGIGQVGAGAAGDAAAIAAQTANTAALTALDAQFTVLLAALGIHTGATVAQTGATVAGAGASAVNTGASVANTAASGANTAAQGVNIGALLSNAAANIGNTAATILNTIAQDAAGIAHIFGFATGTDYVQQTGLAVIHEGEKIVPAHLNPNNPANSLAHWSLPSDQMEFMRDAHGGAAAAGAGGGLAGRGGGAQGGGDVHNHNYNMGGMTVNSNHGQKIDFEQAGRDTMKGMRRKGVFAGNTARKYTGA
jgi:hypothetical protein